MRSYVVPPDIKEKEKIIGGVLDLFQLLWLISGVALGGGLMIGLLVFTGSLPLSLILSFPLLIVGVPFAFVKKKDMTLFRYLMLSRTHRKKIPYLSNIKKGVNWK